MALNSLPEGRGAGVDIDLREVWGILRRQWWIVVASTALAAAAALYLMPRPEPLYRASALVRVEEQGSGLASLAGQAGNQIETEMEVIRSRTVIGSVVDSLRLQVQVHRPDGGAGAPLVASYTILPGLQSAAYRFVGREGGRFEVVERDTDGSVGVFGADAPIALDGVVLTLASAAEAVPEFEIEVRSRDRAIDDVIEGMEVTRPNRSADIIAVAYSDAQPAAARDIVNTIVDRFLYLRNDAQKTEVRSTIEFLRGQLEALAAELNAAENELREFRERSYVINPNVEGSTQVQRLAELQAERSAIAAERAALTSLVDEIEQAAATQDISETSPYRRLAAFPTIMQSQVFSDVLRSLSSLEGERATLLTRRRPEDQDVQVLTSRIADLEEQLKTFVNTYLAGLASRVNSIDTTLNQFSQQLAQLPANEVEFARLSRQPQVLSEMYAMLQTRLKEAEVAQAVEDASVRIVDPAVLPTSATGSMRWALQIVAFTMLGLLLGLTIGFTREYADSSVYTRSDVQGAIGVPVVGLIPKVTQKTWLGSRGTRRLAGRGRPALPSGGGGAVVRANADVSSPVSLLITSDRPNPVADAYDRLHMNILFATSGREPKTILLTSPLPGDGKTTTTSNLAVALARRGLRTLVIDADLRKGSIGTVYGAPREPGLTEVLAGTVPVRDAIRSMPVSEGCVVRYLTTGALPNNPAAIIASTEFRALIEELEQRFDRILIDTPPINIVGDAAVLAQSVDGVVVVARAGVTPHDALTMAAEQFNQARIPVLGAVLNDIDFERHGSYDPAYKSYTYGKKYYTAEV